jgi:hypothetical protein
MADLCDYSDERRYRKAVIELLSAQNGDPLVVGTAEITADVDTSIPAGFQSVVIHKTSAGGIANVAFDTGTYDELDVQDTRLSIEAPPGKVLGAITISTSSGATWAWIGVK